MSNYKHDIFYDVSKLTLEQKKELLIDAKRLSKFWHIDGLRIGEMERKRIPRFRYKTMLDIMTNKDHFVFIYRRGFTKENGRPLSYNEYCIETGVSTLSARDPHLYLFVYVPLKHLDFFVEKYKLTFMI